MAGTALPTRYLHWPGPEIIVRHYCNDQLTLNLLSAAAADPRPRPGSVWEHGTSIRSHWTSWIEHLIPFTQHCARTTCELFDNRNMDISIVLKTFIDIYPNAESKMRSYLCLLLICWFAGLHKMCETWVYSVLLITYLPSAESHCHCTHYITFIHSGGTASIAQVVCMLSVRPEGGHPPLCSLLPERPPDKQQSVVAAQPRNWLCCVL